MQIRRIELRNFRCHEYLDAEFEPGLTVIHGRNGLGKTNLLEGIHYASLTKDFLPVPDRAVLHKDAAGLDVRAEFDAGGRRIRSRVAFEPGVGKQAFVNGVPLTRLSEIVGRFPVVAYAPHDSGLTAGGPAERRRFLAADR